MSVRVSAVVAHDRDYLIGVGNQDKFGLPWRLRDDLIYFKKLTQGHYCIVGRKTYDAMPDLTDRKFCVVSRVYSDKENPYDERHSMICKSVEHAIEMAKMGAIMSQQDEIFIIGGAEIYRAAMPYLNRIYATEVEVDIIPIDKSNASYFPRPSPELWIEDQSHRYEIIRTANRNDFDATVKVYDRA